jgi:hypothetical protein
MPDAAPRPLTAEDVVAEVTAERDRITGEVNDLVNENAQLQDVIAVTERDLADYRDALCAMQRERDEARAENAELTEQLALDMNNWPKCPDCECRLGLGDADRQECGCTGPCTMECRENGYPDAMSYRDLAVAAVQDPGLRARVKLVAAGLRRDADGIEADPHLNPHVRRADAEARRTAAERIDLVAGERPAPRPVREAFEELLSAMRRHAGAVAPSRKAAVRAAVGECEQLIREAMDSD